MNAKDQLKLLNAGFTLIHPGTTMKYAGNGQMQEVLCIKACSPQNRERYVLESMFTSGVAVQRRIKQLLQSQTTVQHIANTQCLSAKDQVKLLNAGFTIIRPGEKTMYAGGDPAGTSPCIKAKTADRTEWHIYQATFPSIAERDRRITELLMLQNVVQD